MSDVTQPWTITVLDNGDIVLETGKVSGREHIKAERIVAALAAELGIDPQDIKRKSRKQEHTHIHTHTHTHSH